MKVKVRELHQVLQVTGTILDTASGIYHGQCLFTWPMVQLCGTVIDVRPMSPDHECADMGYHYVATDDSGYMFHEAWVDRVQPRYRLKLIHVAEGMFLYVFNHDGEHCGALDAEGELRAGAVDWYAFQTFEELGYGLDSYCKRHCIEREDIEVTYG